jgi:NADH dehydrogenase (ubiquinone) 1 alpha subcomplex subunit 5
MLTTSRISEIEGQIGAGLIEEVIQVAEGELKLVDIMAKAKLYESRPPFRKFVFEANGLF